MVGVYWYGDGYLYLYVCCITIIYIECRIEDIKKRCKVKERIESKAGGGSLVI